MTTGETVAMIFMGYTAAAVLCPPSQKIEPETRKTKTFQEKEEEHERKHMSNENYEKKYGRSKT